VHAEALLPQMMKRVNLLNPAYFQVDGKFSDKQYKHCSVHKELLQQNFSKQNKNALTMEQFQT